MTNPSFIYVAVSVIVALILMTLLLKLFPSYFGIASLSRKRFGREPAPRVPVGALSGIITKNSGQSEEVVAVIMAAITAARGRDSGAFRIASINPSQTVEGFNTPAWGHVDRLGR